MNAECDLSGMSVTFVIPHTPEAVGYESGEHFLSVAVYHHHYCLELAKLGANVKLVFLTEEEPPDRASKYDIKTQGVTFGSSFGFEFSVPLYKSLASTNADIVHIHGYNQVNVLPILLSLSLTDSKVVVQNHGSALNYADTKHRLWYLFLTHLFSHTVDSVISVNKEEIKNLERAGMCSGNLALLPNGVDLSTFHPIEESKCRQMLDFDLDKKYMLFVGKISETKGVSFLIKALARLPEDVHLLLVYSGVEEDELTRVKDIIRRNHLGRRVHFIGEVEHSDLKFYYNAVDLCVFPSINEGFGVVTLESMACGTPVVATTEHAAGGHLDPGENALVAKTRSTSSLVDEISLLLESEELRDRVGSRGLETVKKYYSWQEVGKRLQAIYSSL